MITKCSQCSKSFETYAYKIKRHKNLFCSTICQHKFRNNRVKLTCRICDKPFDVQKHRTVNQKECFCSAKCSYEALKVPKIRMNCASCNKEFDVRKCRLKYSKKKYCSRECSDKGAERQVSCKCKHCQKEFSVTKSAKEYDKGKFCSKKCVTEFYSDKHFPTFKHGHGCFKKLSKNRSNICEICTKEGKTDVHHIDGNPFNNVKSNFITLCRSCHSRIHNLSGRHEVLIEKALDIFKIIKDLPSNSRSTWLEIERLKKI